MNDDELPTEELPNELGCETTTFSYPDGAKFVRSGSRTKYIPAKPMRSDGENSPT